MKRSEFASCLVCGWEGEWSDLAIVFIDRNGFEYSEEEIAEQELDLIDFNEEGCCPDCGSTRVDNISNYLSYKNERNIANLKRKVFKLQGDVQALTDVVNFINNPMENKTLPKKRKTFIKNKKKKRKKIN